MCTPSFLTPCPVDPTPFQGLLLVWDVLRMLCAIGALVVMVHSALCAMVAPAHQARRYAALGVGCLLVIMINFQRIGEPPTYVLALSVVMTAAGLYGASAP